VNTADKIGSAGAEQRRRYERFQTRLPARLETDDALEFDCEVRDYCVGGMLIMIANPSPSDARLSEGQSIRLSIQMLSDPAASSITIPASVAWVRKDHLGIAFAKPSRALVDALQKREQSAGAPPSSLSTGDTGNTHSEGHLLSKIRQVAQAALPSILRALLVETVDKLLETAERVDSDSDRQQVYDDLTGLESLRSGDLLMREITTKALHPTQAESSDNRNDEELSLVDTAEFERWLEASRAAVQLERQFSGQLTAIGSRLTKIGKPGTFEGLALPFEPKNFTDALKGVAEQFELGPVTRGVLFDCCIEVLRAHLGQFYQEIDAALDTLGAPQASLGAAQGMTRQQRPARGVSPNEKSVELKDQITPATGPVTAASGSPVYPQGNTVAVDSAVLERLVAHDREMRKTQAHEMLDNLAAATDGGQGMQGWLKMLNGPLVSEAATDPEFFQGKTHPLHNIFDALGQLQLFRASPETDAKEDELRRQVDALLEPLSEGEVNTDVLRSVAADVSDLAHKQSEFYQRNVKRVIEASEGRDRLRQARHAVTQELERRYLGHSVPVVVAELIDIGWRKVLELAWLSSPDKSQEFERQLAILDAIIAHLGGEAFDTEAVRPAPPELLAHVSRELETTAIDPFRRSAVETRLQNELLGPALIDVRLAPMPKLGDDSDTVVADRPRKIPEAAWKEALAACATLRLGDRLRFVDTDSGESSARVAWIREDRELYTLVDHKGVRTRDIGLTELATGLYKHTIRIEQVDGQPLSGRAIDQMLDAMETRLRGLASRDSLTGLMSRRQFHGALDDVLKSSVAADKCSALLWIDIDQFKLINDIHGYTTGDRLLIAVSRLLEQQAADDIVAHLGADRFGVLLSERSLEEADSWAESLCDAARNMPFDWEGSSTALSVSVGVVAAAGDSVGTLMQAAENALSAAKSAGGDRCYVYHDDDPSLNRQRESVKWVARVDEALVEGELRLRCQPIVPVRPGEGIAPHYEVLLGVVDASRESLSIAEFIDAAERYNRMRAVDRWVTKSVFDWIATHREQMSQVHSLAVNLSGQTASEPAFVDFARQQFQRTGISPDWISFEITETAAVGSLSDTAGIMHELKQLGCKVALDDFGSGLASYSYLKELPVDWLKIDGVFVQDIVNNREDYAVVKSINEIGHFLGKQTIAEYVKDQPTLELVREIGVDFAQGFGISPPILLDDLLQRPAD